MHHHTVYTHTKKCASYSYKSLLLRNYNNLYIFTVNCLDHLLISNPYIKIEPQNFLKSYKN